MNFANYDLVAIGDYMGKTGYIVFLAILSLLLIAIIGGSVHSQDMYVYSDGDSYNCT